MIDDNTTCSGAELAALFGIGDRRIQQLAAAGVLEKAGHGRYKLAACVRGFVASIEGRGDTDELRDVRIALMSAQTRRIETEIRDKEANAQQLEQQTSLITWLGQEALNGYRSIASNVYAELQGRGLGDQVAREVGLRVEQWGVGARAELERRLAALDTAARREQTRVTDYWTAERLASGAEGDDGE